MTRVFSIALIALAFAGPLAAQMPGLMIRADGSNTAQTPGEVADITITPAGDGVQVSTGPAVTLWNENQRANGGYTLTGSFSVAQSSGDSAGYGLVFGGRNLNSENQWYLSFTVTEAGEFAVLNRIDNVNTNEIVPPTAHAAIQRPSANGGAANELAVQIGDDEIEFVVNGTVVHTVERTGVLLDTNGLWGSRIGGGVSGVTVGGVDVSTME